MPIETGCYFIINVQTKNHAFLPNANSEPVQGRFKQDDLGEQWDVIKHDNGHHTIKNFGHKQYAASGNLSQAGAPVTGWEKPQTWLIQKPTGKGQYIISTTDTRVFWGLADGEQSTPIILSDAPTNPFNWWMFKEVKTGNDAKVDPHLDTDTAAGDTALRAVYLLELAPPPAPLPEPFELDLVVIQEIPYNFKFIRNATETANKICSPLFKCKHLDASNLLIQVIEFEPFQEAYHFRSLGPDSFNKLRHYRGEKLLWTVCSGPVIPFLLTKGMDDFQSRPSTTKVIVLNLRYIPLQNGGQEQLQELIDRMKNVDVILIVTLSEPHRSDTIFDADLFQELLRLSSGSILSLPADGGGFYPHIVDYLQHFDSHSIATISSNIKTINPEIYLRPQQPDGTLNPEKVIQGSPNQPSSSLPSAASPPISSPIPIQNIALQPTQHIHRDHHPTPMHAQDPTLSFYDVASQPTQNIHSGRFPGMAINEQDHSISTTIYAPDNSNKIYERYLGLKRRGFPLWIPQPNRTLPIPYRRKGVSIGDVGIITSTGAFAFLFNICLPHDDPINPPELPDGFVPIYPPIQPMDIREYSEFNSENYLASTAIEKIHNPQFRGLSFTTSAAEGAILILPDGAIARDLDNVPRFRAYAAAHVENWYRYVNGPRGREVKNGEIRLVYGCDKATSWGMAAVANITQNKTHYLNYCSIEDIGPNTVPIPLYKWEYTGLAETRVGPELEEIMDIKRNDDSDVAVEGKYRNQSLFIRTLNLTVSEEVFAKISLEVESALIQESQQHRNMGASGNLNSSTNNPPHTSAQTGQKSGSNSGTQTGSTSESLGSATQELVVDNVQRKRLIMSRSSSAPKLHPADVLNKLLLQRVPNSRAVITQDDDWCSVVNEDDKIMPSRQEIAERVLAAHHIREEDGVVFLEAKQEHQRTFHQHHTSAISTLQSAVELTPEGHASMPSRLSNLDVTSAISIGSEYTFPPHTRVEVSNWKNDAFMLKVFLSSDSASGSTSALASDIPRPALKFILADSQQTADIKLTITQSDSHPAVEVVINRLDPLTSVIDPSRTEFKLDISELRYLPHILNRVSHFHFHLRNYNPDTPLKDEIGVQFFELDSTDTPLPDNLFTNVPPRSKPVINGHAHIIENRRKRYGFRISNRSRSDVFPYLFYFDPRTYKIKDWHIPNESLSAQIGFSPTDMTVGFGAGGGFPFTFTVPDIPNISSDTGFLKLFVSTERISSLADIKQSDPLTPVESDRSGDRSAPMGGLWDVWIGAITVKRGEI